MKTPIEVKDIRKGDLIRWERGELAHEFRTTADEHGWVLNDGQHYLLDRPTPPVELPTEPTLGWVDGDWSGGPRLAVWLREDNTWLKAVDSDGDTAQTHVPGVKSFMPAVAVPASALDELRSAMASSYSTTGACHKFLAAVDAANGDAS